MNKIKNKQLNKAKEKKSKLEKFVWSDNDIVFEKSKKSRKDLELKKY